MNQAVEQGREITVEQMTAVLAKMTDEQFQRFIKEAEVLLRQWYMQDDTTDPSGRE